MYDWINTAMTQMGAVGLLLAFAGYVLYQLRIDCNERSKKYDLDLAAKDSKIHEEIDKREKLIREVLDNHRETMVAISAVVARMEEALDRIDTHAEDKRKDPVPR